MPAAEPRAIHPVHLRLYNTVTPLPHKGLQFTKHPPHESNPTTNLNFQLFARSPIEMIAASINSPTTPNVTDSTVSQPETLSEPILSQEILKHLDEKMMANIQLDSEKPTGDSYRIVVVNKATGTSAVSAETSNGLPDCIPCEQKTDSQSSGQATLTSNDTNADRAPTAEPSPSSNPKSAFHRIGQSFHSAYTTGRSLLQKCWRASKPALSVVYDRGKEVYNALSPWVATKAIAAVKQVVNDLPEPAHAFPMIIKLKGLHVVCKYGMLLGWWNVFIVGLAIVIVLRGPDKKVSRTGI